MRIGYFRALKWGLTVEQMEDQMRLADIDRLYHENYTTIGSPERDAAVKALREGDTLVVPSLGYLGSSEEDVLEVLNALVLRKIKVVCLWDKLELGQEVLLFARAMASAKRQWKRDRAQRLDRETLRRRGQAGGRKEKMPDPKDRKMAEAFWKNPELVTADVLDLIEQTVGIRVSDDWCLKKFGKRPPALYDPKAYGKRRK